MTASPAQVVLAWAMQRGTNPIAKSSSADRLRENLGAGDLTLSEEDMAAIGGLLAVALFVVSRRPAVSRHPALWSPDFPLAANDTDSDHPADFARAFYAAPTGSVVLSMSLTSGASTRRPARKWLLSS